MMSLTFGLFTQVRGSGPLGPLVLKIVYCVYSLESPRRGDSYENTQFTFVIKTIETIALVCLHTWFYD